MIYQEGKVTLNIVHCKNCDTEILKEQLPLCGACTEWYIQEDQMKEISKFYKKYCAPCISCGQPMEKADIGHTHYRNVHCGECEPVLVPTTVLEYT